MKPYRAKTLIGAERMVRRWRRAHAGVLADLKKSAAIIEELKMHRRTLAKCAADGPCFDNPMFAAAAKILRDRILRDECGLSPDGKRLEGAKP